MRALFWPVFCDQIIAVTSNECCAREELNIAGDNTVTFLTSIIVKRKSIQKPAVAVSTDLAQERCSSGVEGLDDILAGGFPRAGFQITLSLPRGSDM
jgi:hypothetical protein